MATTVIVGGIKPNLKILGDTQRFLFEYPNGILRLENILPIESNVINLDLDLLNIQEKGYRAGFFSDSSNINGTFHLSSLEYQQNQQNSGIIGSFLMTFNENSSDQFLFYKNINVNNNRISNVATPDADTDAANKIFVVEYVNSVLPVNTVSLLGDITGSGVTGTPINTSLSNVINKTTNQIFNYTATGSTAASFDFDLTIPNSTNKTLRFRMNRDNTSDGAGYEFQFYAPTNGIDTLTFGYNSGSQFGAIYSIANNAQVINYNYALNINDSGNYKPYSGSYGYLNSSGNTGTASGQNPYSINCNNRVKASEFDSVSSIKTKNIESSSKDIEEEALKIFSKIPFFKYSYKDKIKNGEGVTFGVIAEPLKEILPDYVVEDKSFVPNILQSCLIKPITECSYELVFKEKLTNIEGSKLQLILLNKSVEVEILKTTPKRLIISCSEKLPGNGFAYGTFETCPSVTKNKLFELSMVVLKNTLKRVDILERKLKKLKR
jgi:hypothetical protein